jgi:hypothetical protein
MRLSYFGLFRWRHSPNPSAPTFRPSVESLEERAVPAFVPTPHLVLPPAHHAAGHALALAGKVSGTWSDQMRPPDWGNTESLSGAGAVGPLGIVQLSGTLSTPGFILRGYTSGTVVLSNARGSLTVQLKSASPQPGFTAPAAVLHYRIMGGTGAYAGDSGSGVAHLQQTGQILEPGLPAGGPQRVIPRRFTLTFG